MVTPAMQLAGKIPDVHVQLWASSLLKGNRKLDILPLMCVSDYKPDSHGSAPHQRHYAVVLEQETFILLSTGSTQEDPSLLN